MFALSLVYFLSLLLSPSTYFNIYLFLSKVSFELHVQNLQKNSCWFKIWMGFVGPILIKLWTSSIWGFFFSCLCEGLPGIAYANMLVTTQWPLKRPVHLTSLVWVCVLWMPWKLNGAICAMTATIPWRWRLNTKLQQTAKIHSGRGTMSKLIFGSELNCWKFRFALVHILINLSRRILAWHMLSWHVHHLWSCDLMILFEMVMGIDCEIVPRPLNGNPNSEASRSSMEKLK